MEARRDRAVTGRARFCQPRAGRVPVEAAGQTLHYKRAVIATGARAAGLPIEGLEEAGYLTNETVFTLTERPKRLAVLGSGPIGCELAQAFQNLGSDVTVVELGPRILGREDGAWHVRRRRVALRPVPFKPYLVQVTDGLTVGERIAVRGVGGLRDAMQVSIAEDESWSSLPVA